MSPRKLLSLRATNSGFYIWFQNLGSALKKKKFSNVLKGKNEFLWALLIPTFRIFRTYDLVQFSSSVMSNFATLWTVAHQASLSIITPRVYSNPCPLSWWCHPTISFSVIPFSSHLQIFPASGSFQMSQFFALGGQSIGVSQLQHQSFQRRFRTDFF